MIVTDTYANEI